MSDRPQSRKFLRVPDFDTRQNPKRPKRPTWIKSFVRDLDDPEYTKLSLATRGFFYGFCLLAADMQNRVPYDLSFIARRLGTRPANVRQALDTCLVGGWLLEFHDTPELRKNKDMSEENATPSIPPSYPHSPSMSPERGGKVDRTSVPESHSEHSVRCVQCDGRGCAWCESKP